MCHVPRENRENAGLSANTLQKLKKIVYEEIFSVTQNVLEWLRLVISKGIRTWLCEEVCSPTLKTMRRDILGVAR